MERALPSSPSFHRGASLAQGSGPRLLLLAGRGGVRPGRAAGCIARDHGGGGGTEPASLLPGACSPLPEAGETSSINKPPVWGSAVATYLVALGKLPLLPVKQDAWTQDTWVSSSQGDAQESRR